MLLGRAHLPTRMLAQGSPSTRTLGACPNRAPGNSISSHKDPTMDFPKTKTSAMGEERWREPFWQDAQLGTQHPAGAGRAICLANEPNKVPNRQQQGWGEALSVSHPVPYRRSDLRCGWVSQVVGHTGKQTVGNNPEKTEPWEKRAQQKPQWGLGAQPAFQMHVSGTREASCRKGSQSYKGIGA